MSEGRKGGGGFHAVLMRCISISRKQTDRPYGGVLFFFAHPSMVLDAPFFGGIIKRDSFFFFFSSWRAILHVCKSVEWTRDDLFNDDKEGGEGGGGWKVGGFLALVYRLPYPKP